MNDKERFKLAMQYLFKAEGAYSNHKCDKGGATNYGITQKTYDYYRKKKELCLEPVINITKQEAENIYYEDFWLLSGANKENDFGRSFGIAVWRFLHRHGSQTPIIYSDF